MAEAPVFGLLLRMSLPLMLSMMIQALYNIVDSVFIGMLPERAEALQALGYAYPIQMLLVAGGVGTGIGVNALLSRSLGEKDGKKAAAAAGNGYFLMLCFYFAFLVFGFFVLFRGAYFDLCTQNARIRELGQIYLGICLVFSFGQFILLIAERQLCAVGRTGLAMTMQLAGALTNIALDPLFIFAFDMGAAGAAVATVLQCLQSLTTLIMQLVFGFLWEGDVKDLLVGIYGIFYKLQYFVLMLGYGLTNASLSLLAYNFGKRDRERVKKTILSTLAIAAVVAVYRRTMRESSAAPDSPAGTDAGTTPGTEGAHDPF